MTLKQIIFFFLTLSFSFSQNKLIETKSRGIIIERGYENPQGERVGNWKRFFEDGILREETNYKNGKRDGINKEFYKSGQLKSKCNYKDNFRVGKYRSYYENGKKEAILKYKNQKLNGISKVFYNDGSLMKITKNVDGMPIELHAYYNDGSLKEIQGTDENGNYISKMYSEKGILLRSYYISKNKKYRESKGFYLTGLLKEEETSESDNNDRPTKKNVRKFNELGKLIEDYDFDGYGSGKVKIYGDSLNETYSTIRGQKEGLYESRYLDNQIAEIGHYKKNLKDSLWKSYYENGKIKFIGKYISARHGEVKDSVHTFFYKNGNIQKINIYRAVKGMYDNLSTEKQGNWKTFFENGNLHESINYDKSFKHGKYETFHENGTKDIIAYYDHGYLIGEYKSFYSNSNLKEIITNYSYDHKNGLCKTFYENGNLKSESFFEDGLKQGKSIDYFENGNIKAKGVYKDNNPEYGIWELYYLNDIMAQKITYGENEKILNFFYPDGSKLADINLAIVDKRLEFKNIKLYNDKGVEVTYEEFAGLDTKTCKVLSVNFSYESENASVYCDIFYEESGIKNKTFRKEFKSLR